MLLSDIICLIDEKESFCLEIIYGESYFQGRNYTPEEAIDDKLLDKKVIKLRTGRQGIIITIEVNS